MIGWETLHGAARVALAACWCGMALAFFVRPRGPSPATARRAPAARWGLALQALAFFIAWTASRDRYPGFALAGWGQVAADGFALVLAVSSVWFVVEAVRVLGKQWSVQARLIEGHRLVVAGPYSHVRNPIYAGMLGLLVATGLVFSVWFALAAAVVLYVAGTVIRVRSEERLLAGAFGEDFEAYRQHVPALIPRWKSH